MLRRGILVLVIAAGLFGGSAAAGFLLAKGALRHTPAPSVPSAAAPRSPEAASGGAAAGAGSVPAPAAGAPPLSPAPGPAGPSATPPVSSDAVTPGSPPAAPSPSPRAVPTVPAPARQPDTAVHPAPAGGTVIPGRFHVQVAGFPERQNADALAVRLRTQGYAVTVTDGPPYRVWVGGYLDRATAERLAAYLTQGGFSPTLVPQ